MQARFTTIEGRTVRVIERAPPIPPTLELMLEGGRDASGRLWPPIRSVGRSTLRLGGTRPSCLREDHRLLPWVEGFHTGSDAIVRHLRLLACRDCGAVCVRDISIDSLPGLRSGRLAPRRRDHILGWYTGSRPRQRVYT